MKKFYTLLILILCLPLVKVKAQGGTFIDYGFIPGNVSCSVSDSYFQSAMYNNGFVYIATSDGVWKNNLATQQWSVSGLQGKIVTSLFRHPDVPGYFLAGVKTDNTPTGKTLYLSEDAGLTWEAAESPIFEQELDVYENYVCFAVRPGHPEQIFANLEGGTTIAVSTDYGETWNRANYEPMSYFGYASCIAFNPLDPDKLYQGSENPLDDAWVGTYDINSEDPVILENYTKLYGIETWSNRRPMELMAFENTGSIIYVCQEGALSKITEESHEFLYISNSNTEEQPYTYMEGIWVDPENNQHAIYGGNGHGGLEYLHLFETYDDGATYHRFDEMFDTVLPYVREIIATDTYPVVIIDDYNQNRSKLVMYQPGQLSVPGEEMAQKIKIYPNPASNEINISCNETETQTLEIEVYNMLGQLVYHGQMTPGVNTINVTSLKSGTYAVHIKADKRVYTEKILKL